MFGTLGMPELIVIFVIALIVFGPRKLPELGKSLGRSIAEFKKAVNDMHSTLEDEIRIDAQKAAATGGGVSDRAVSPADDTASSSGVRG